MEKKDAPSLVSDEQGRIDGLISAWLIPPVPPPAPLCALAALIGIGMAVLIRVALLGLHGGVGATQPFFPAIMMVTLYAGWRWGLIPTVAGGAFGWWLWGGREGVPLSEDELSTLVIYLLCAVMVVAIAEGLRGAIRGLARIKRDLGDAEERLRVTQTAAGVGPWEFNLETGELYFSPAARRNLGAPLEGPMQLADMAQYVHPDDREIARERVRAALTGSEEYEVEYRLADTSQGERWVHGRGEVVRDATGKPVRMIGLNFDVTNRRRAEEQVRESEARFRALADSAPALMWTSRPGGAREFVNQAYVDFAGLSYDEAMTLDWRSRLFPEDLPGILKAQIEGEASLKPFSLEGRYRRADGEWRWLKSFSQPRLDSSGVFSGFSGIAFDITDAKRAEENLTNINELLSERAAAAVAERDAAQAALLQAQKLEAIGQLTGGVAHDFNNLLTVVIGALDVVARHPDDARRRERMIGAALAAARRGEKLTQHLLAFARRQPLKPEVRRVDGLIAESEELLKRALGDAYGFKLRLGAGVRAARIDAGQFEAALLNLVVNARDATPAGGSVTIESGAVTISEPRGELEPGVYLKVSVRDTGSGMDAATIARAVEPFFTTKPPGQGTGLGLSQVYGFARQSGGSVEIESVVGEGSSVSLLLPVVEAGAPRNAAQKVDPIRAQTPSRVLLVEDDHQVAELVEAMLNDLGHAVVRAGGVDEALARLDDDGEIELVLSDVIMPGGKSGVDLAEQLAVSRPGLPVVLCSGYVGGDQSRARAGDWPFISKPFSLETLAQALSQARPG
ncbi:PAS domain-containing sensor histidine kinase [Caulobacter segnis]|uniref:histidine kinase n=1 Tax=Caulobacter segnis TaxID=88688 RepID=A0A2W5WJE8_9CAUL|nr:PAS domain-containing sensor histidine kinase [Caulobacter segnis]PZR33948.1 MAG: hybrid sensor histidine kinase/response regulator [Caulobacter segnis]